MSDKSAEDPVDQRIAAVADRQHGHVATRQLKALGLSRQAVAQRASAGRLHRVHHGVYAVGHRRVPRHGHFMAAVLAMGPGALLSHRSAAALHDLRRSDAALIDVTVPRRRTSRPGIRTHHPHRLEPDDTVVLDGIPCTSVTRTIVDLASVLTERQLASILRQAERLRVLDAGAIRSRLGSGVKGAATLRRLLDQWRDDEDVRNDFEADFLSAIVDAQLPLPQCNVPFAGYVPDFRWPHHKLVVELDGWEDHGTRRNFEEDRQRDAKLLTLGYRVMRVTWRRFKTQPRAVMADLAALLEP